MINHTPHLTIPPTIESSSPPLTTIYHFSGLDITIYRKKMKHIRLSIKAHTIAPHISLSCPLSATEQDIMRCLEKNEQWLKRTYAAIQARAHAQNQALEEKPNEILLFGEWIPAIPFALVRERFIAYLNERVPMFAKEMGVSYSKLSVRDARTRLGSCTKDRLSFSLLLAFAPKEEIDYVIIHELAHLEHKNHSTRFWELVEQHCPQWKVLRKSVKARYPICALMLDKIQQI